MKWRLISEKKERKKWKEEKNEKSNEGEPEAKRREEQTWRRAWNCPRRPEGDEETPPPRVRPRFNNLRECLCMVHAAVYPRARCLYLLQSTHAARTSNAGLNRERIFARWSALEWGWLTRCVICVFFYISKCYYVFVTLDDSCIFFSLPSRLCLPPMCTYPRMPLWCAFIQTRPSAHLQLSRGCVLVTIPTYPSVIPIS